MSPHLAVAAFGRFALTSRDTAATIRQAVEALTGELGMPMGAVLRLRSDPDMVSIVHGTSGIGPDPGVPFGVDPRLRLIHGAGEPLIVPDWTVASPFALSPAGLSAGVRACVSVSIEVDGRPWGRLAAMDRRPRPFTVDEVTFAESIGRLLAAVLDRDRIERCEATVAAFGRFAVTSTDAAATIERAIEVATGVLATPMGAVVRPAAGPGGLAVIHSRGPVGTAPAAEQEIGRAPGGPLSGDPLIVEDWRTETRFPVPQAVRAAGMGSSLSVALMVAGHPAGRLSVWDTRPRRFTATQVDALRSIAHLLGAALEQEVATRTRTLVARFERFTIRSPDIDTTMREAVAVVAEALRAPMAALVQILGPGMAAVLHSVGPVGPASGESSEVDPTMALSGSSPGPGPGRGFWHPEPRSSPRARTGSGAERVSLSVTLPLDGRPWGRLVVSDNVPRPVQAAEVAVLHEVASVLAGALARERVASGQSAISAFGRFALGSRDIAVTIERAVDVLTRVLDAPTASLVRRTGHPDRMAVVHVAGPVGLSPGQEYDVSADLAAAYMSTDPVIIDDWCTETRFTSPLIARTAGSVSSVSVTVIVAGCEWGRLIVSDPRPRRFSLLEVDMIQSLADLLAAALEREQIEAQARQTARELQRALPAAVHPPAPPRLAGVEAAGRYTPVSDDRAGVAWYDVVPLPAGGVGLVTGQVQGRDPAAAEVMARVRDVAREYACRGRRPAEIMTGLNRFLARHTDLTVSCCFAALRPAERSLTCVSAGHPPPMVLTPDGFLRSVPVPPEIVLGRDLGAGYSERSVLLPEGSTVLMATAGLVGDLPDAVHPGPTPARDQGDRAVEDLADDLISHASSAAGHPQDDALLAVRLVPSARGLAPGGRPEQAYRRFAPTPATASAARLFVLDVLAGWGLPGLEPTAALVVSELVTNAVVHAGSRIHVTLRRIADTRVWIGVSDDCERLPHRRRATLDDVSGRGLAIVEELADSWGVHQPLDLGGKIVWLELTSRPEPERLSAGRAPTGGPTRETRVPRRMSAGIATGPG